MLTIAIKQHAKKIGFSDCGIAKVRILEEEKKHIEKWLQNNYNGQMSYMNNHFEMRLNPRLILENAKSIIVVTENYKQPQKQPKNTYKISQYAYGKDYHKVIKKKLKALFQFIQEKIPDVTGRYFVDTPPVLEKKWAVEAGLGCIGKNTALVTPQGSMFFIGEIIIDKELDYDHPFETDLCQTCTQCLDACPTKALVEPYILDARRCISYLTIENKKELPPEIKNKFGNQIYGCDICHNICPHNKNAASTNNENLLCNNQLLTLTKKDWENLTEEQFNQLFKQSAIKRIKYEGLKRNINFIKTKK